METTGSFSVWEQSSMETGRKKRLNVKLQVLDCSPSTLQPNPFFQLMLFHIKYTTKNCSGHCIHFKHYPPARQRAFKGSTAQIYLEGRNYLLPPREGCICRVSYSGNKNRVYCRDNFPAAHEYLPNLLNQLQNQTFLIQFLQLCFILDTYNHRMAWFGRERSSSSNLSTVCNGMPSTRLRFPRVQSNLALNFQGGEMHSLSGQTVPVPHHPRSNEFLPNILSKSLL